MLLSVRGRWEQIYAQVGSIPIKGPTDRLPLSALPVPSHYSIVTIDTLPLLQSSSQKYQGQLDHKDLALARLSSVEMTHTF